MKQPMFRTILLSLLFILPLGGFAQSDANAVKLLKAVSKKYDQYNTMKMQVNLVIHDLESGTKDNRKGTVLVKGDKFRINTADQEIICDGKTIWTYLPDVNEVQINNFDPRDEMLTPDRIFQLAESDFLCLLGDKYTSGGKTHQVVELIPNDKSANYSKIKLHVETGGHSVAKAVVHDKSAIRYTYQVNGFNGNVSLSDGQFRFRKEDHPGVDIIDLR